MFHRSALVLALFAVAGCQDEALSPLDGGGGAGGTGDGAGPGVGPTGGGGVGGNAPMADRGDPASFPTDCHTDCQAACQAIVACGSESSPVHPIDYQGCLDRCGLQENGPIWEDISGTFKCCASQTDCSAAAHCAGWLAHPDTTPPCEKICECFFSSTVSALSSGHAAPHGYQFARDVVFVEGGADFRSVPGVRDVEPGRISIVTLGRGETAATRAALEAKGRVLPTFTDAKGRLSAANGRVIVKAGAPAAKAAADRELRRAGAGPAKKVRFAQDLWMYTVPDAWLAVDAVSRATKAGVVAELDMVRLYERRFSPNDPLYEDQWHLKNIGQGPSTPSVDARVDEAWDVTKGSSAAIIAINDDGVDLDHPDFAGKLAPELNFPDDWKTQMQAGLFGGHGTSCAGVAGAKGNNLFAGSGACPDCTVLPHLLGPTTGISFQVSDTEIAEGFEAMVDAGAWVISNSWGPSTGNPVYEEPQLPIGGLPNVVKAAFDYAETSGRQGLGTVIVFAAGNSNDILDPIGSYVTNLDVGAVNDLGLKSYYSSFGPNLDIAAPSNGGMSGITTTAANGQTTPSFGGTSSACPLVSGIVGLVLSANPNLTAAQARDIVTSTARKIDPVFGQYDRNGVSPFYGHGMIDAARAVRLAAGLCADAASCRAPSDECGAACGTRVPCDICRTTADCAAGTVCQALPSLGILTCVAPRGAGSCADGTTEVAGYCLPLPSTCNLCAPGETCNGRDDDCNGLADDGGACEETERCFFEGPGCPEGKACAGTSCVAVCSVDEDCQAGQVCENLKNAYGAVTGITGCVSSSAGGCQIGCEVLASTLNDADLAEFVTCMEGAGCNEAFGCTDKLPISM